MKIVVDCRMIRHSGIGRYLQSLLPGIAAELPITTLGCAEELRRFDWFAPDRHVEFLAPIYSLREQVGTPRRVPRGTDVLWTPHINVPMGRVPQARKRLVTVHDVFHLRHLTSMNPVRRAYVKRLMRAVAVRSDAVVTVSEFTKGELTALTTCDASKCRTIHNAVADCFFDLPDESPDGDAALRAKYGLPEDYLLFVGNVKPHKNLGIIVRSLRKVASALPGISLVIVGRREGFIVGDGELKRLLTADEDLARRVHFTGFADDGDLPAIYRGARALVFPSLYEGFGLPPLEAMAAGVPVAASDAASIPEICGDAALYFDARSDDRGEVRTAEALLGVLTDHSLRADLIAKGSRRARRFSWDAGAKAHIEVLRRLAE